MFVRCKLTYRDFVSCALLSIRVVGFFRLFAFYGFLFRLERLRPRIIFVGVGCCEWVISADDIFGLFVIGSVVISLPKLPLRGVLDLISPVDFIGISHNRIFDIAFQPFAQLIFEIILLLALPE
jgi:hypothetical protein